MKIKNNQNLFNTEIQGSGEPILCLSGFGCDHYNFDWLKLDGLMVKLDNRGFGGSENNLESYSILQLAQDANSVMNILGYESYHVVGISMGGMIAQELALRFPAVVKTLSLLCTTGPGDEFVSLPKLTEDDLKKFYELDLEVAARRAVSATCYQKNKIDSIVKLRCAHPAKLSEVLKQKRAVDEFLKEPIPLSEINVPTLVMTGANDRYVSPNNSHLIHQRIKNSKLIEVENTDHLFFLEEPKIVSDHINSFIAEEN